MIHNVRNDTILHVSGQEPPMSSKYPPSWPFLPDTLPIEISTWNFQGMFLSIKEHHSWHQEWPFHPCLWSGTFIVLQVPPFLTPPLRETLPIEISAPNFQGNFLWVKKPHSWHKDWRCHPHIWAGTLNVLEVTPILTLDFLPHFQLRYQHKIFRVCSLLPKSNLYPYHFKTNFDQPQTNDNPNQTFAPSNYPQP